MFSKSTDHGNDVMVLQFFFLFLRSKIFQEISTEIDIKTVTVNVMVKKKKTNRQQFPMAGFKITDRRSPVLMTGQIFFSLEKP